MLNALAAPLDRLIANAIVSRARRRWLPLRLVPAAWMRPFVKPAATLIRRELSRSAATAVVTAGVLLTVVVLAGR
jgi:hypothetical protein